MERILSFHHSNKSRKQEPTHERLCKYRSEYSLKEKKISGDVQRTVTKSGEKYVISRG